MQLSAAKRLDKKKTVAILYSAIARLIQYIEPKRGMNDDDIIEAVEFILDDYWQYKLDEILAVIHEMRKSGEYYERLKYPEINKRLREYFYGQARADKIARHHQRFKASEMDEKLLDDVDYDKYRERVSEELKKPTGTFTGRLTDQQLADRFLANTCRLKGVTPEEVKSKCKFRECSDVRHVVSYYLVKSLNWTYEKAGAYFGRDHTCALNSVKQAVDLGLVIEDKKETGE